MYRAAEWDAAGRKGKPMLKIEIQNNDNEIIVLLEGMIDSTVSDEFAGKMEEVLAKKPSVIVLDFEKADYISSAGFRILFMVAKEMKKNEGRLIARHVCAEIQNLFSMVHMDHVMEIE